MSAKKTNARTEKWRAMLAAGLQRDHSLLVSRTHKGVPPALRNIVWLKLIPLEKHIQKRKNDINYEKLINRISDNTYEISLDIPRTFPQEQDSKALRKSLNDVLKAISIVYPEIGYCQGMNFLTRRLLQVLDNEQAFWVLHYLLENDIYLKNNFIDPSSIQVHDFIFNALLKEQMSQLHKHLTENGVYLNSFTIKSFMTLYSGVLNQQSFNRIFQIYLLEGWEIIYSIALGMFKIHEKQLKNGSMQSLQEMLSRKIFVIQDIDLLISEALKFSVNSSKLKKLDLQFNKKKKQQMKDKKIVNRPTQRNSTNINKKFKPQSENLSQLVFQGRPKDNMNFQILEVLKHRI